MKKIVSILAIVGLSSCCGICEQDAPALRPMPECGVYVVEDIIEIPVERTGK